MAKIENLLFEVLEEISPSESEMTEMNFLLKKFLKEINEKIKKEKIEVKPFLGGSFAKGTVTKKDSYDADIFFRFDKKYPQEEYSEKIKKILMGKKYEIVHGSRDYFKLRLKDNFYIEIIPVKKISRPEESENITDLSYSHVKYLNKKISDKRILGEIKLAKAFCKQGLWSRKLH
jgi:tRNA nucleotidyltransferase (CCA-adding enzyme)